MAHACYRGHREIVELLISKGANDWNLGLANACFGRSSEHQEIVELMISKGANNWTHSLQNACLNRCYAIIVILLQKADERLRIHGHYNISPQILVEEHGLPITKLKKLDNSEYCRIIDKYKTVKKIISYVFPVTDLSCFIIKYLIR